MLQKMIKAKELNCEKDKLSINFIFSETGMLKYEDLKREMDGGQN